MSVWWICDSLSGTTKLWHEILSGYGQGRGMSRGMSKITPNLRLHRVVHLRSWLRSIAHSISLCSRALLLKTVGPYHSSLISVFIEYPRASSEVLCSALHACCVEPASTANRGDNSCSSFERFLYITSSYNFTERLPSIFVQFSRSFLFFFISDELKVA